MVDKQAVLARRNEILGVAQKHGASDVRVFGSVLHGEGGEAHDLDLLVTLEADRDLLDLVAIKQDLEDLLGFSVDVVTENALSPYLRDSVLQEAAAL